jgi:dipeptidyl-peptidase-4
MLGALLAVTLAANASLFDPDFLQAAAETRNFLRGRPQSPQLTPDGKVVLYLRSAARSPSLGLFQLDVASGQESPLVTPAELLGGQGEQLSVEEKARRERLRIMDSGFTAFSLSEDGATVLVLLSGKPYVVDRAARKAREVTVGPGAVTDPQLSPDGKQLAYVQAHDLHVADPGKGTHRPLTTGGNANLLHGEAEFVAQEELARSTGYWWSPDSTHIAYTEVDQSKVERFTISDPLHPESPGDAFAYPRPGKANATVKLGVVPAAGGKTVWVQHADAETFSYLALARWAPGGKHLLAVWLNREQTVHRFEWVDAQTGKVAATREDQHPSAATQKFAWLDVGLGSPRLVKDGFLALSPRSGELELVRISLTSDDVQVLLPATAGPRALVAADGQAAYVLAGTDPTDTQVWKVPLDGKPASPLTTGVGEHWAVFGKDGHFVEGFMDERHLPVLTVRDGAGAALKAVPDTAEAPTFWPLVEFTTVEVPDGERALTLHAAILRPRDFDPAKKYPVIDSVYGGPHANQVLRDPSRLLLDQWYADHGFIVVRVDNRGSPRRPWAFEHAIGGDLSRAAVADQTAAVAALARKYPELDATRVGVNGWSFGGYLSAMCVLRQPETFKVGVAGAPVVDWADYDTAYTERYMGTPQDNAAGYAAGDVLTYAKDLSRPLLVIHGTADDNVYFFHSLKLMDALFRAGKRADFMPLPGLTHIVASPTARVALYSQIIGYFVQHLGGPTAPPAAPKQALPHPECK